MDLLLSIINVSVQTVDIVESLPKIDFAVQASDELTETADVQTNQTTEVMKPKTHTDHIYSIPDLVKLLPLSEGQVRRLVKELEKQSYEGVIQSPYNPNQSLINFHGMVEILVIYDLYKYIDTKNGKETERVRIPLNQILDARKTLQGWYDTNYPFAQEPILKQCYVEGRLIAWQNPDNPEIILRLEKSMGTQMLLAFKNFYLHNLGYKAGVVDYVIAKTSVYYYSTPYYQDGKLCTMKCHISAEAIKGFYDRALEGDSLIVPEDQRKAFAFDLTVRNYPDEEEQALRDAIEISELSLSFKQEA